MKPNSKKIYFLMALLLGGFVLTSTFLVLRYRSTLQPPTETQIFFPQEPFFLQKEPGFEKIKIGESSRTLASHGSATLALSMALYAMGWQIAPEALAALIAKENGYTAEGEPQWYLVTAITGGRLEVEVPNSPNRSLIEKSLKKGQPILAEVESLSQKRHWVFIVGKKGFEFLVKDPLAPEKTLQSLGDDAGVIKNVRILKKRGQWSL